MNRQPLTRVGLVALLALILLGGVQLLLNCLSLAPAIHASVVAQGTSNIVALERITTTAGTSGTFAIALDNIDAVASGQLRITYDAGFGLDITDVSVTDRTAGFTVDGVNFPIDNPALSGYQALFFTLEDRTIAPGTGAILTISYTVASGASGSTPLRFDLAILASSAAEALPLETVEGALTIALEVTPTPNPTPSATPVNRLYLPIIQNE